MSLTPYLRSWRTTPLHDREVIDALVDRAHEAPSGELTAALREWPGSYYWSEEVDGLHLVLTRPTYKPREAWAVHALLLVGALITMTIAGGVFAGVLTGDITGWTVRGLLRARSGPAVEDAELVRLVPRAVLEYIDREGLYR